MIELLPITTLHYNLPTNPNDHYNLPTNPNELNVYIEMDDKTAKELSSPGCDELTFDDVTGLSSRILHQLVRNHFNDPKQGTEYQWFTNPRSQGCPRFQSGEELANSVGRINAYYSL